MKRVEVVWEDARSLNDGWSPIEEIRAGKLARITTVGYLVQTDETRVVVCQSIGEEHIQGSMVIPRTCVISFNELAVG